MAHTHEHPPAGEPPTGAQRPGFDELDAAGQSLTNALRVSFAILKVIMILLVVLFAFSGIFRVQPDEEAVVLRFGLFRGEGEDRILRPGLRFAFPEPIEEVIRIPVQRVQTLPIDTFWYFETEQDRLRQTQRPATGPLNPLRDGYSLTRNDRQTDLEGTDYNIVHSRWSITYRIRSPIAFFESIYIRSREPGEDLLEAAAETLEPLLNSLASNAIVGTMVHYSIDDAVRSRADIATDVQYALQRKLDALGSGIVVDAVRADRIIWPRQVDNAFQASNRARQESEQARIDAASYKERLLTDVGGPLAEDVLRKLRDSDMSDQEQEQQIRLLSGQVQSKIADARTYRMRVVEEAKANAEYLQALLPEYRKRPQLVLQQLYQDAVQQVLGDADEKIVIQPGRDGKTREVRVLINRDPQVRRQPTDEQGAPRR